MTMLAVLAVWGLLDLAFLAGIWWGSRERRLRPRVVVEATRFRRVARPCLVARARRPDQDFVAVAADFIAERADFDASARAVLDELVVDLATRRKW